MAEVTDNTSTVRPAETASHYLALYRKYRPQTFEDVVGRDAIVRTLKNQIVSGRIGHSYLFCGTRGTGKTTIAKIFAKAVNCEHPVDGSPCGVCPTCRAIAQDADLNVVEMDAASNNGVDDVRGIIDQVSYSPTQGRYRVFIIDEVHMLSPAAFNALLKTLEEPPAYAIFILATTEPNRLPVTILSRCQRYDFGRLPIRVIEDRLQEVCKREGLNCEEKALRYIASAADGSMRDGLSILDQCNAFNYGNEILTYDKTLEILGAVDTSVFSQLFQCIHQSHPAKALDILDEILAQGRELVQFVTDFIGYLRNVMLLKSSEEIADSLDVSSDHLQLMLQDARSSELEEDIRYINVFSQLTEQIRYSANRRILTEAAIIRLCEPSMDIARNEAEAIAQLQERIRVLEEKIAQDEAALANGRVQGITAGSAALQTSPVGPSSAAGAGEVASAAPQGQNAAHNAGDVLSGMAGEPAGGIAAAAERPHLPAALPEDIQKIAGMWDQIVASLPKEQHLMKIYLQKANPTVTDDGQLLLVFENYVYCDFFSGKGKEANAAFFADYLANKVGRQVGVQYKALDNQQKFSDNYVDIRAITSAVNMDIGEEDTE